MFLVEAIAISRDMKPQTCRFAQKGGECTVEIYG